MTNNNPTYNEEEIYTLMMEALDGELSPAGWQQLHQSLELHPQLAREWSAMQAVDQLFSQAQLITPASHFAPATIAKLPDLKYRRSLLATVYTAVLMAGFAPLIALLWFITPWLLQAGVPTVVSETGQFLSVFFNAFFLILLNFGELLRHNPAILGLFMVMVGSISLWSGVYRHLVNQPQLA